MRFDRQSGVFMHLTSLPGPHGIGDLGAGARDFLEFLDDAGQSLWQFCPVGPTSEAHGNSPYQSFSAFAGNPHLISLEKLTDRGWLSEDDLAPVPEFDRHRTEYHRVSEFKMNALRTAFENFRETASEAEQSEFEAFRERESTWLRGYTLFRALKQEFGGDLWTNWPHEVKTRDPDALARYRDELEDEVDFRAFAQYVFDEQWREFKAEAEDRNISLVGDLPIYVALDSADVWAAPEAFQLDENNEPVDVAGVPPDMGDAGQKWGNPLYDWGRLEENGFDWWIDRLERLFDLVDVARLDHFKGFDAYWAIPAHADSPAEGEWRPGPGIRFFDAVESALGELPFIAEDLGHLDEGMLTLRDRFEFPGMRVPHYADWCSPHHRYKPSDYPENCVAYTATHDTNTTVGWYQTLADQQRDCLHYALGTDGSDINWTLIESVWNSNAVVAVTTMQDLLGLDSHARFNTPGTAEGNWGWRVTRDGLSDDIADRLRGLNDIYIR